MLAILHATAIVIVNLFKSHRRLEAENVLLRHQLSIALPKIMSGRIDDAVLPRWEWRQ